MEGTSPLALQNGPVKLLPGAIPKRKTRRIIAGINQEEIEDPTILADSDSLFSEFNGVQLHHKICDTLEGGSSSQSCVPLVLLHGFGASIFTWDKVMKPLAKVIKSKVVAFDRPAFGLTSRPNAIKQSSISNQDIKTLHPYSTLFSASATLHFVDSLAAEKAILVGHSAGALVALDAYFEAPESVAALILVAPGILVPFTMRRHSQGVRANQIQRNINDHLNKRWDFFLLFYSILWKFVTYIANPMVNIVRIITSMIKSHFKQALAAILRSTFGLMVETLTQSSSIGNQRKIRMIINKFGIAIIRKAWYDSNKVSDHVLQGYTKPLKVKDWDKALVEFTVSMFTDSPSKLKPPLAERLNLISCPVLIVTGDTDRLIPVWNSKRLSRAIPGSQFEIIKNCGHIPQEEKAEEFVSIVDKFLGVFGDRHRILLER